MANVSAGAHGDKRRPSCVNNPALHYENTGEFIDECQAKQEPNLDPTQGRNPRVVFLPARRRWLRWQLGRAPIAPLTVGVRHREKKRLGGLCNLLG